MKTALEYITQELSIFGSSNSIKNPDCAFVRKAASLYDIDPPYEDDTLYYIAGDGPLNRTTFPQNIFCSAQLRSPELLSLPANIVFTDNPVPSTELRKTIKRVTTSLDRSTLLMQKLINFVRLNRMAPFQEIAELLTSFFEAGVLILNSSFQYMAASSFHNFHQEELEHIKRGYANEAVMQVFRRQHRDRILYNNLPYLLTKAEEVPIPFRISDHAYGYLDIPIRINNKTIGILTLIPGTHPFSNMEIDCLQDAAALISFIWIKKSSFLPSIANPYEAYLRDVVLGNAQGDSAIRARFREMGRKLEKYLFVGCIPLHDVNLSPTESIDSIQSNLRRLIPNAISGYIDSTIVLLIYRNTPEIQIDEKNSQLHVFLSLNRMNLGISRAFTDADEISHNVVLIRELVALARQLHPDNPCFFYEAEYPDLLISKSMPLMNVRDLCIPALFDLYDSNHESDCVLLYTLEQYLLHDRNTKKICETLHIHSSTLFYRINKIKEIIGSELDYETLSRVFLTLRVLEYHKCINASALKSQVKQ